MDHDKIMDAANMAETHPGSGRLNWGEVPFSALAAWVDLHPQWSVFDVESVRGAFEDWWNGGGEA